MSTPERHRLLRGTAVALVLGGNVAAAIGWAASLIWLPPEEAGVPTHREHVRGTLVFGLALLGAIAGASSFLLSFPSTLTRILSPVAGALIVVFLLAVGANATIPLMAIVQATSLAALLPAAIIGWILWRHWRGSDRQS